MATDEDITFVRGLIQYAALGAIHFEPRSFHPANHALVTVVAVGDGVCVGSSWLSECLSQMEEACDVYRQDIFLEGVIMTNVKPDQLTAAADCQKHLQALGAKWLEVRTDKDDVARRLLPGPYLYVNKFLKPVYRVYDDKQGAFLAALKPKLAGHDTGSFAQLRVAGTFYDCLGIAVPSRTPEIFHSSRRRLRVVVKDLFRVKGLNTSLKNRAYYETSTPATSTAAVIESLARDGAHILGMTKLSSMIAREEPLDAVDFHTAFNPLGDGYQSPAGSSSGSVAAVAAYDWVDCNIGTDTSGSGRRPALVNGVW